MAALDLQTGSEAVLARALQLATAHAARLVLLHVIEAEPLSHAASVSGRSESDLRSRVKRQALATIEPLLIESGRTRRTEVQVEFGSPHDIITRMAKERHADVIVVGPGKRRTRKERIPGLHDGQGDQDSAYICPRGQKAVKRTLSTGGGRR